MTAPNLRPVASLTRPPGYTAQDDPGADAHTADGEVAEFYRQAAVAARSLVRRLDGIAPAEVKADPLWNHLVVDAQCLPHDSRKEPMRIVRSLARLIDPLSAAYAVIAALDECYP